MKATRLRITSLKFISAVDAGAQGPVSNVALVKRASTGDQYQLTAKVAKLDEKLGVVFGYAVASTVDGGASPHIDLQGDAVVGGDELIKVALGFAEAGAQSDVMHDCIKDGWVPFVMPLNAETKKAFKLSGDVEGIAIGMKPSKETFKRFLDGELGAFSIYGEGIRTPLEDEAKRAQSGKVAKAMLYTTEEMGHQHTVSICEDGSLWVSYATSEGAEDQHTHGAVFKNGAVTILADSGHTHSLAEGQPGIAVVPADAIVVVAALSPTTNPANALAPQTKSTRPAPMPHGGLNATPTEKSQMPNEQDKTIADLTAKLAKAERIAKLSGAHKAHFDKLAGDDAEQFLSKSNAERDALVAEVAKRDEEANKVVYVSKSTGDVYKAKDDPRLVEMAKAMDKQAETIEKANIRKQAADVLGGMPGADEAHDLIVRSLVKSGAKQEEIDAAFAVLKGMKATSTIGKGAPGVGGTDPQPANADQALAKLEKGLTAFAKTQNLNNVWTDGLAAYVKTDEGAALKRAYDEAQIAG